MTFPPLILPVLVHDLSSPDSTSPPSSNQTDLATSAGSSLDSRSLTNMLVVTTTVGVFNWVHRNTTDLRPAVSLDLVLMVGSTSLQHRFVKRPPPATMPIIALLAEGMTFLLPLGNLTL